MVHLRKRLRPRPLAGAAALCRAVRGREPCLPGRQVQNCAGCWLGRLARPCLTHGRLGQRRLWRHGDVRLRRRWPRSDQRPGSHSRSQGPVHLRRARRQCKPVSPGRFWQREICGPVRGEGSPGRCIAHGGARGMPGVLQPRPARQRPGRRGRRGLREAELPCDRIATGCGCCCRPPSPGWSPWGGGRCRAHGRGLGLATGHQRTSAGDRGPKAGGQGTQHGCAPRAGHGGVACCLT
mmetsp:Transcript_30896/g.98636  ORF Transcript_30896/g.98636 Transcript_30896/m.98636 type:complete len:237 (+) Transcript_30896:1018-1728(+)